ncbi:hypothetical protein N8I77_012663 [Diaporthe amygdali]|uniref:Heme haloperoxidase family profile domain-containing protein n=1 Tax=Phomopsis amygdali TaxID=1214568 RepID=A0AAD9S367_PHOAM|nr:chloroperoxidase-like protein [Diaporthe amygdali]KAJ0119589.1 chloroperoxidase-like protein [Diaporthe amygdali]KAK2597911.1 hypothetical protein N8I77_012663 [Diaporthe amygdali]
MHSFKSLCLATAAALIPFSAALDETTYPWQAPTDTDVRSPCPALNALANHGLLPRDGKGITIGVLSDAAYTGFTVAADATLVFGSLAFQTSTTGNASTFNLDDLKQHTPHVLEHDGSMSRNDSYWGDNLSFNEQAWARTLANWGDNEVITFAVAAAERTARFEYGLATNPEFNASVAQTSSLLEYSLILSSFGDLVEGNGNATFIKYLFENERLPIELGWQPPTSNLTIAAAQVMAAKIAALL